MKLFQQLVAVIIILGAARCAPGQNMPARPLRFFETFGLLNAKQNETNILQWAAKMVTNGYAAAGWDGVLIDEPWLGGHDANGDCYANSNSFPHGMAWLVGQLHSLGLKAGLFFTLGHNGVVGPGSWGFWEQDATNAAMWGTDFVYLVVDDNGYGGDGDLNYSYYQRFIAALPGTGTNIAVMGTTHHWEPWLTNSLDAGQLWVWPGYTDFNGTQWALLRAVDNFPAQAFNIRPGHYLAYGWFGTTRDYFGNWSLDLCKAVYAMMSLWHSPLSCGQIYDSSEIPDWRSVHTNQLMLALDADPGAFPPQLIASTNQMQVWAEPLGSTNSGRLAIAFLNRSSGVTDTNVFSVAWTNFGFADKVPYVIQDVWGNTVFTASTREITATVPPYGCSLFLVSTPTPLWTNTVSASPAAGGITSGGGPVYGISSVTVCASPNPAYFFANWSENGGVVSTSPRYTFLSSSNRNLTANFEPGENGLPPTNWTVTTVSSPPIGGLTGGGGNYADGQTVTVCAISNPCHEFVNWTEDTNVASTFSCYTFTTVGIHHLVANFALTAFQITATPSAAEAGNVSGGGSVDCGNSVTLTAVAKTNYQFIAWTESGVTVATAPSYTFTPTVDRALTANFSRNTFSIGTACQPAVGGSTMGGGIVNSGDDLTVSVVTNSGFIFLSWLENGGVVSTSPNYTFTVVGNRNLVANLMPLFPLLDFNSPFLDSSGFNLLLAAPIGFEYSIESSADCFNWLTLTNFVSTNSPTYFSDPAAVNFTQRYYRAVMH